MEHGDFEDDWQYLPSPEEHARECWDWLVGVLENPVERVVAPEGEK